MGCWVRADELHNYCVVCSERFLLFPVLIKKAGQKMFFGINIAFLAKQGFLIDKILLIKVSQSRFLS